MPAFADAARAVTAGSDMRTLIHFTIQRKPRKVRQCILTINLP